MFKSSIYVLLAISSIYLLLGFHPNDTPNPMDGTIIHDSSITRGMDSEFKIIAPPRKVPQLMILKNERSVPLRMSALTISTEIIDNIAITTVDMTFANDSNRVLSGDLYFPLGEGQTISQFALEVNGKMRDGVPVEKAKGREVYERMIRRGIDPGLVELTKGNNFKTRIYPIPAKGTKRVIVSYEQELLKSDGDFIYSLPLFYNQSVNHFSLNVSVEGDKKPTIEKIGKDNLSNFKFKNWQELFVASHEEENFFANQMLMISIPFNKKNTRSIVQKSKNGNHYFYKQVTPQHFTKKKDSPKSICVLWDASLSAKNRDSQKELDVLQKYFEKTQATVRLLVFANDIISDEEYNNWREASAIIKNLQADGATNLHAIPWSDLKTDEIILISDMIHTFGEEGITPPSRPTHVINSSEGSDYAMQTFLTNSTGGQTIKLSTTTADQAAEQMGEIAYQFISTEIIHGDGMEIYPQIPQKVTNGFGVVGIMTSDKIELKLNFGFGNQVAWSTNVTIDAQDGYTNKELAGRLWAEKKLKDMDVFYEKNQEEILALGKAFSIVTKNTSLIVLDNIMDYVNNEIIPPAELQEDYNRIINDKLRTRTKADQAKIQLVKSNWENRVTWWNKTFDPKPKAKSYLWENDDDRSRTGEHQESPRMSPSRDSASPVANRMAIQSEQGDNLAEEEIFGINDRREVGNKKIGTDPNKPSNQFSSKKEIKINEWKPDNETYKKLSKIEPGQCYSEYLNMRSPEGNQPIFYADVARVLREKGQNEEALRVLSNLAEMELENHELLKVLANTLMEWEEYTLATFVYEEILKQREEEPQSYRDLGLALHADGKHQEAIEMLYQVVEKNWDGRFPEIENIVLGEINGIIANSPQSLDANFMDTDLIDHLPVDMRIIIDWDADNMDIDLWVTDPRKEKCFYSHPDTEIGGHISRDFTRGYGPEEFLLKKAIHGTYKIEVNYYGSSQQRIAGPPTIKARLVSNYGLENETEQTIILRMKNSKEVVYIGEMIVG